MREGTKEEVVRARVQKELAAAVRRVAKQMGLRTSEVVRLALSKYCIRSSEEADDGRK